MIKIYNYNEIDISKILDRTQNSNNVSDIVHDIIDNVRANGDKALFEYSERFDNVKLTSLRVNEDEINDAFESVDSEFIRVLKLAEKNIREFHEHQVHSGFIFTKDNGVVMGQRIIPIEKVGLYVPGGTASLSSTVLMDAIPAKIAACKKIIMTTPPMKNGKVHPSVLAAAKIAGVDEIYKIGGAQAVAALAYGTNSVPRVDKIVGPGNAFVAEAKRQVYGIVAIDMIAGPSDILIVADGKSNPELVAADMLSQAEHDKIASAVLVTDSATLAQDVAVEIDNQLCFLERADIARASIDNMSKIIITDSLDTAIDIANEIAPEHLELCVNSPFEYLCKVKNAGSVFLGRSCPEALGDYLAGPNHTLPTGGTARFSSPLSVDDFIKKTQFTFFPSNALNLVAEDVALFAREEGLTAHAKSVTIRTKNIIKESIS